MCVGVLSSFLCLGFLLIVYSILWMVVLRWGMLKLLLVGVLLGSLKVMLDVVGGVIGVFFCDVRCGFIVIIGFCEGDCLFGGWVCMMSELLM